MGALVECKKVLDHEELDVIEVMDVLALWKYLEDALKA